MTIYEDNNGCICMASNVECKKSKHIYIKHYFIRDYIEKGVIKVEHIGKIDKWLICLLNN